MVLRKQHLYCISITNQQRKKFRMKTLDKYHYFGTKQKQHLGNRFWWLMPGSDGSNMQWCLWTLRVMFVVALDLSAVGFMVNKKEFAVPSTPFANISRDIMTAGCNMHYLKRFTRVLLVEYHKITSIQHIQII